MHTSQHQWPEIATLLFDLIHPFRHILPLLSLSVLSGAHMVMLSEFPAKIAGACKARVRCNNRNRLLGCQELRRRTGQPVTYKVRYRGCMNREFDS